MGIGATIKAAWADVRTALPEDQELAAFQHHAAIEEEINKWYAHPADCAYWQGPLRAAAGSKELGPGIMDALKKGSKAPIATPTEPGPQPQEPGVPAPVAGVGGVDAHSADAAGGTGS